MTSMRDSLAFSAHLAKLMGLRIVLVGRPGLTGGAAMLLSLNPTPGGVLDAGLFGNQQNNHNSVEGACRTGN
jgi:hypothetical protein